MRDGASKAFEDALAIVNDQTSLRSRLELSFEARRLGRDDAIVDLLKGRVATDRENEALHTLIAAAIDSRRWVTAREIFDFYFTRASGSGLVQESGGDSCDKYWRYKGR